jgi:hypothetical protein
MQSTELPSFYNLKPEEIEDQIEDLRRQKQGATLIYAIDPHEIFDFCFPVLGSEVKNRDVRRIADDQIALYEVFFKIDPPPILLGEYAPELDNILSHFSRDFRRGFNRLDNVKTMLERGGKPGDEEKLKSYILRNFNVLLAAVMGIYSSGAERLQQISERLTQPRPETEAAALADAFVAYRPSSLTDDIFDLLVKGIRFRDAFDEQRVRGSARLDALVIHKLIHLNECLIKAHREGRLRKPILCLYLSSAARSARVFNAEKVRSILPDLGGTPFNFWRTRAQIFSAIVYGGKTLDEAIERLEGVRKVLRQTLAIKETAELHAAAATGEMGARLDELVGVAGELEQKRMEAANLGLVRNLEKFQELTQIAAQKDEIAVRIFLEIYQQKRPDGALEDMQTALRLMVSQSEFGSDYSRIMLPSLTAVSGGRDPSRSVQYLGVRVKIPAESNHLETYRQLVQLYTVHMSKTEAVKKLLGVYNHFLVTQPSVEEPDYELIRCLLYLSFFSEEGNQKASDLARSLSKRFVKYRYEFAYIAGWADRRLGKFQAAYDTAVECVKNFPGDPRFHHSLAITAHEWYVKSGSHALLLKAISEIEVAIKQYQVSRSDDADLIGTCYNNLAYYLSRSPEDQCFNPVRAHDALKQLKIYIPEATWAPMHPEYYHTEANLELQDVQFAQETGEKAIEKLRRAERRIDHAIALVAREDYRVLKTDIETHIALLANPETRPQ